MQLKCTDLADADLENIEAYIARENSLAVALDLIKYFVDSVHLILSDYPRAGRQDRVKNMR